MTDVSNDRETPATDPTAAADEEAAHVRPDPPDDRDLRYPPVDAAPSGHLEPLDHQLLRQALQSDGTIAEPLTTPGFHVPPPMAATPGDEGTPWPEPLVEESTVAWGEESTTMWTEPLIEQAHEESTDASDPTAGESVDEVFECLHYRDLADPAWRQRGQECTGFALAAIVNYHLRVDLGPDGWAAASPGERLARTVSRRMLYEMAQVYDREDFVEGSTLRGALKGWAQAGVAADHAWPYAPGDEHGEIHGSLTVPRSLDSAGRPGALYLRVDPNDPEAMKSALERGFPLFASAQTHGGWFDMYLPGHDAIERPDDAVLGGAHAFAIYGYDSRGWLIHNSWGPEWGDDGCARLGFDDFADAAQDVWFVFRPRRLEFVDIADQTPFESPPSRHPAGPLPASTDMWLHRVSIGDDGGLSKSGRFGMSPDELGTQLYLFRKRTRHWKRRRLAIVADPGYWDARDTLEALTPLCEQMMAEEIYPLFLVWDSPWFDGLRGWLHAEAGTDPTAFTATEPGPASDDPTGLDLDDTWSVLAKFLVAQSAAPRIWRQVHAAARTALRPQAGAGWILADRLAYNLTRASFDVHLVGYGAGDLLLSELAMLLPAPVASCQLWSPTTTMQRFADTYASLLAAKRLDRLHLITLASDAERTDRTGPVPGSLLQIASDVLDVDDLDLTTAVETRDEGLRWTPTSQPMLGLHETIANDPRLVRRIADGSIVETSLQTGTHIGLLTDPACWAATIASITSTNPDLANARPVRLPPADDSPDTDTKSVEGTAILDPLDWVISHTKR